MLATSSSDDEDYIDTRNTNKKPSVISQPSQQSNSSFLKQSNTSNNANRKHLANGFSDDKSTRSSFSESSENISLNNFNQKRVNNVGNKPANVTRNSSFKSNSSSNTIGNNQTANSLSTPRVQHRKKSRPRKSGDLSSINGDNVDGDSDTSDYNYESHFTANQANNEQSDEDQNNETETNHNESEHDNTINDNHSVTVVKTSNRKHRSKNQESTEEQEAAAAAAAALVQQQNEALKELEIHKRKLQIYVFVCRCISYPFIAKQPTDMVRRQLKITKQQLNTIKDNFDSFLQSKMPNIEADEAFTNAVRSYYEVFLKSDRIYKMVLAGGCSATDFRDVFKNNIEKRVRSLPEIGK